MQPNAPISEPQEVPIQESLNEDNPAASKIANVRTRAARKRDSSLELRCSSELKRAFKEKAQKAGSDMSQILFQAVEDYVAGPAGGRPLADIGREVRMKQFSELRRRQAQLINLLFDIRRLVSQASISGLAEEAILALLESTERSSRETFDVLKRHVP